MSAGDKGDYSSRCHAENVTGYGAGDGVWVKCELPEGHDGDHHDDFYGETWPRGEGSDIGGPAS